MIFFVVGPTGVGKTYYSERMKKKFGIPYYDTGPLLRSEFKKLNLDMSFKEWIEQNEIKTNGTFAMEFIAKSISELIDLSVDNIIIGNRCIEGINAIVNKLPNVEYYIIYLDASYDCLMKNYELREKENITFSQYKAIIDGDYEMGLKKLKEIVKKSDQHLYVYKNDNEDINYIDIIKSRMVGENNENILSYKL